MAGIEGMNTVLSRSSMPEKVQEVTDRASQNKQIVTTFEGQKEQDTKSKKVQNTNKTEYANAVRAKDENAERQKKEKDQKDNNQKKKPFNGNHLDIKA